MIDDIIGIFDSNLEQTGGSNNNSFIKKTKLYVYDSDKEIRTMLIPLSESTTITVGFFIKAGSRQETEAYGIAHFLEHMTFKGTNKRTSIQLMEELDSLGAVYNAGTSYEYTYYYISGDPRDINILLEIITDLYLDPIYPDEDIKKELNVVLEELKMYQDNNSRSLMHALFKHIYKDKDESLARPIIGFEKSIKAFNRKDIINFRKKNYKSKNSLLVISGNFDKVKILEKIEELLDMKTSLIKDPDTSYHNNIHDSLSIIPFNIKNKLLVLEKDIKQTIINFVFNGLNMYNKNNIKLDILTNILSSGFSSRLFNLLRNKMGVSYYNDSHNSNFSDTGQFMISVGVDPKSVLKTIKAILDELKSLIEDGIEDLELKKAKKQQETGLLFSFKDPYEYFHYYGMHELTKKPYYSISEILDDIDKVTKKEINNIIKQLFNQDNLVIGIIGSKLSKDDIKLINSYILL